MLDQIPMPEELTALLGAERYAAWCDAAVLVDRLYEMETAWNPGGKRWTYEYKYRRGGKTLCALYARKDCFGFMVILGKKEREQFEARREEFSAVAQAEYDAATTYHDGKWLMLTPSDASLLPDIERLLFIKRKPRAFLKTQTHSAI